MDGALKDTLLRFYRLTLRLFPKKESTGGDSLKTLIFNKLVYKL